MDPHVNILYKSYVILPLVNKTLTSIILTFSLNSYEKASCKGKIRHYIDPSSRISRMDLPIFSAMIFFKSGGLL